MLEGTVPGGDDLPKDQVRGTAMAREFPEGRYWIGDPGLVLSDGRYQEFLEGGGHGDRDFEFEGRRVMVACVEGDDLYDCEFGSCVVESGRIGIMPADLAEPGIDVEMFGFLVDGPLRVEFGAGRHSFGVGGPDESRDWYHIRLDCADEDEDEADEVNEGDPDGDGPAGTMPGSR